MRILKITLFMMSFVLFSIASDRIDKPFLWEVQKSEQRFYLFGTMHLADPKLQSLPKALKRVIDSSEGVRTEIPMDLHTQLKASSMMLRNDGKKLKDILPSKLYKRTEEYLQKVNPTMTLAPFENIKIWAISAIISMLENQLKYPMMKSIDGVIFDYAKSQKKDIGGVETLEEQLGAMDRFTLEEQILSLKSLLDYLEKERGSIDKMKELYIRGDSKAMMSFIESMMFQMPKYKKIEEKFMQLLLHDRNIKMADRIEKLLQKEPKKKFVFAFGVMHFLGEKSVIELLQRDGYRVRRIR